MIFPFVDKFDLDLHLIDLHSDYVTLQGKREVFNSCTKFEFVQYKY